MTPLAVFFRTLSRTSAIFIGTAIVFLHPPLDWAPERSVSAGKAPRAAAIEGLELALRDPDARVRLAVRRALEAYTYAAARSATVAELTAQRAERQGGASPPAGSMGDWRSRRANARCSGARATP